MGLFDNKKTKIEEQEEETSDTYTFDYKCDNCGDDRVTWEIPKGKTVEDFLKDKKCDNCGCYIIQKEKPSLGTR